jgi:hypothetical protein
MNVCLVQYYLGAERGVVRRRCVNLIACTDCCTVVQHCHGLRWQCLVKSWLKSDTRAVVTYCHSLWPLTRAGVLGLRPMRTLLTAYWMQGTLG